MNALQRSRWELALRFGSDAEIREAAREIFEEAWDKGEAAEELAEGLKAHKPSFMVQEWGEELRYDGLKIRRGPFQELEVEG